MDKIIFATGNEHKMIEIRAILSDLGVEILSQKEAGIKGTMDLAKKLEHIVLFEKGKHEKGVLALKSINTEIINLRKEFQEKEEQVKIKK